jgi:hypothetical protein
MELSTAGSWQSVFSRPRALAGQPLAACDLTFAGWVAIVAVATSVPRLTFEVVLSTLGGGAQLVHAALQLSDAALGVYLFLALRRLLTERSSFRPADSIVAWWTAFGAFFCAMNLLLPRCNGTPFGLAAFSLAISIGAVLDITLGIILFRLKDDPYGGLTAYACSHIAAGTCIILSTMY